MQPPCTLLLRRGTILTQDRRLPRARALAVVGERVLATSHADDGLDDLIGPATRVFDLDGAAVVPGFVDSHVHFGHFALARQQVDLDTAATLEDAQTILERHARQLPPTAWVQGRGWDRNRWGRLPNRHDLDRATGGRAAALSSHDGHSLWLSSAALREAGLTRDTPAPAGGVIERETDGEPAGVVFENAQDLVRPRIPEPTDAELQRAVEEALKLTASYGLTGIHNLEDARTRRAFQAIEAAGQLTLRVYHGVARGELNEARERGLRSGFGSDLVRIGPVKLFADGALGSRTAWMLEPYEGRSDEGYRGVPTLEPAELDEALHLAADASLDVAVHAIGDAAVRGVLDAYERNQQAYPLLRQRLLRIEHAQIVHPDDVPRFAKLGVIASMQPIHATADWRIADEHWGSRSRRGYAWRSLLQAGATLAFGTDAPVESIQPLVSLHSATTRRDSAGEPANGWYPEQRLTLEEAVRAYTRGAAAAEGAVARRGMLSAGMDADLAVLDPDPFGAGAEGIEQTRVALTMVGGRITFEGGAK